MNFAVISNAIENSWMDMKLNFELQETGYLELSRFFEATDCWDEAHLAKAIREHAPELQVFWIQFKI